MPVQSLDHVNLRTTQIDEMIQWYADVLDMHPGPRPDFKFPGAWLYAGDRAAVHLVAVEGDPATGSETRLKLEHFAFSATDEAAFAERLTSLNAPFKRLPIPDFNLVQYNIWDPDGNHIHVDFAAA